MQVHAGVAEADVGRLEPGMTATFTSTPIPEREVRGRGPADPRRAADVQNVVTYDAVIDVDNADLKLKPGHDRQRHLRLRGAEGRAADPERGAAVPRRPRTWSAGKAGDGGAAKTKNTKREAAAAAAATRTDERNRAASTSATQDASGRSTASSSRRSRWRSGSSDGNKVEVRNGALGRRRRAGDRRDLDRASRRGKNKAAVLTGGDADDDGRRPRRSSRSPTSPRPTAWATSRCRRCAASRSTSATGEFVAVMGPSGRASRRCMNILGCLDRPTPGSYRLAGEDVAGLDADELAEIRNRTLGFVFQSFNLLARTTRARERRAAAALRGRATREQRRARATAALERVGLGERLRPPAQPALRRAAAARRDRARAGQPAAPDPRRRADRQPRLADQRRDHGAVPGAGAPGITDRAGHPRARHRRVRVAA